MSANHHRCTAIIGNLLSNSRIAVAYRVAEPRKIPYLNFSFYEGSIVSRYFFHFAALPNQQIERMIPYMREKYGPRMFFAGNNYEWPRGSIHAGKVALEGTGGVVVGEEYCPIGVSSAMIDSLLDQVAETEPDVFVPYFAGEDQMAFLARFTERGLKNHMAVVMGHYDEMMASNLSPDVREGFFSSNTYFMTVDTPENRDFLTRLSEYPEVTGVWPKGNGILTNFGEGTYVCVKAFAEAANRAGSLESEALIDALRTTEIHAPQGTVHMNPQHHHGRVNTYLSRCGADGVFSIVEEFGAIDPVLPERYRHQVIKQSPTPDEDIRLQARILGLMSEAVFIVGVEDKSVVYANAGAERMFGYGAGELPGLPITQFCQAPEGDSETFFDDVFSVLVRKGDWQGEIRRIGKDGSGGSCSLSVFAFTHPVHGEVWLFVATDITERKQAEENLKKSEVRFKDLYDNAPDMHLSIDAKTGKILQCNDTLTHYLGFSKDEIIGRPIMDLYHPDSIETAKKCISDFTNTGSAESNDLMIRKKDGGAINVSLRVSAVRDQKGNIIVSRSVWRDITDLKRSEEALRVSEERFAFAISGTNDGLWDWNIATSENYMSPRFKEILGYQDSELENKVDVFFNSLHPDDVERINEEVLAHLEERVPYNTEYRLRQKDGNYVWIHAKGQAVWDDNGKPLRMAGSISDISERKLAEKATKESEARFKGILEIAPEAVIAIGADMNIQLFNQGAERIFGYTADEVMDRPLDILMPERYRKTHSKHVEAFNGSGDAYRLMDQRQELNGLRKDGSEFPASASVSKLEIGGDTIFTVLLHDITERKHTQNALIAAKGEAETASHAKSQFLAAVSHELRTPLNAILGFSQILKGEYFGPLGDKKYQEYAKDIDSSGEHLLSLVDDLLDITSIEAGKLSLAKEELSTDEVIAECVKIVDRKALNGGINLVTNVAENMSPLYADFRATKQVILNLLSNAIKFTPKGGKIIVSAKATKENTTIKVTDTGKGIPAEKLPELTGMFIRAEDDSYKAEKGWGLGLSITKSLVDLHDGNLDIKSKVGKGTTVTVTLPNTV